MLDDQVLGCEFESMCLALPALQLPYTIVFTKADKRKKGVPSAEDNMAAFEQASLLPSSDVKPAQPAPANPIADRLAAVLTARRSCSRWWGMRRPCW